MHLMHEAQKNESLIIFLAECALSYLEFDLVGVISQNVSLIAD